MNGIVPNRRGHAIIDEWIGVRFVGQEFQDVERLPDLLHRLDLRRRRPNPGSAAIDDLKPLLRSAVERARDHVRQVRNVTQRRIDDELQEKLERLEKLKERHEGQLRLRFDIEKGIRAAQEAKLERELVRREAMFESYWEWILETRQTADDPNPYVRVIAVFRG
jgi:hypothetical protein